MADGVSRVHSLSVVQESDLTRYLFDLRLGARRDAEQTVRVDRNSGNKSTNPIRAGLRKNSSHGKWRVGRVLQAAAMGFVAAACAGGEASQSQAEPQKNTASGRIILAANSGSSSDALTQSPFVSPYGAYLAGIVAGYERDVSAATDFMLYALRFDPHNPQLLRRSFALTAADGRYKKATELAESLVKIDPTHGIANLVLAVDAASQGEWAKADQIIADLPSRGLNTLTGPMIQAWTQVARGDREAALQRLSILKENKGFSVLYRLHLALINDVMGAQDEAEVAYEEILTNVGDPTLRLVWLVGNFYERAGKPEKARQLYQTFLERRPNSTLMEPILAQLDSGVAAQPQVTGAGDGIAEVLFNIAGLLSQERAEDAALVHVHQALRLKPDFLVASVLLGEVLQSQQRGDEAIAVYRDVPVDSPFSWTTRLRIAEELERLGRVDDAVNELEALASVEPNRFEPLFRLGNLLRGEERFEAAVVAYDRAAERLGELEPQHWTLLYFRGIALERSKNWPRAEADFLKALELEPEQPFVMNYLAYSWVEQKQNLAEARKMLIRAVELRPEDGYIVDSLGWVLYRMGEYEDAVVYLEQAVELRPQDSVINDHLGDAYWRVGRQKEARFQWRRALSLKPDEDLIPELQSKVSRGLNASNDI